ncbi:NIPSNAP family protein [Sandaracinobacter sp. RS1-74]|uniref:NIPSNAP family protein n=1 Tax=Sandaracinobacteroides sayramensis TaxID=2913411 RepID=UPI001EDA2D0E|nr:NIPSNAP family protein [Sandaracinobacteroides sayramensis]MCG2840532.1 NIPSNAP family protein [Sandaracinobacteroides sayramensis]
MAVYLHNVIRAVPGKRAELLEVIQTELKPMMEREGWKLLSVYYGLSGAINHYTAWWELADVDSYERGRAAVAAHPDFPRVRALLDSCLADETITLMDRRL